MSQLTTCLWFDSTAEEAANFYVSLFTNIGRSASIKRTARYSEAGAAASGQRAGSAMTVEFELDGMSFLGLNGGPMFTFSPATSFIITCTDQDEIDYFWSHLSEGGQSGQCGWINSDRFGIAWQVVPKILGELMANPDPAKSGHAMQAMLKMKKLDIAELEQAVM